MSIIYHSDELISPKTAAATVTLAGFLRVYRLIEV